VAVSLKDRVDRDEGKNSEGSVEMSSQDRELKRKIFVLQIVQPGLAGLMDGSVSTLAPVFAAAFATHNSWTAFLVGMAASLGAGISMGFAEALSDDGILSGRGRPWMRGGVCGIMTTFGGIGHTLPFLVPNFDWALWVAVAVVAVELRCHCLDKKALYGYSASPSRFPNCSRRDSRIYNRYFDWEPLTDADPRFEQEEP
jgi:hypothetical protein